MTGTQELLLRESCAVPETRYADMPLDQEFGTYLRNICPFVSSIVSVNPKDGTAPILGAKAMLIDRGLLAFMDLPKLAARIRKRLPGVKVKAGKRMLLLSAMPDAFVNLTIAVGLTNAEIVEVYRDLCLEPDDPSPENPVIAGIREKLVKAGMIDLVEGVAP